eukprot:s366_g32.t1
MPRERRQRKAAEKTCVSRDFDDSRKALSGEKSVSSLRFQSCQQEGLSRFSDVKGKPDQEKAASSDKDAERKKCQDQGVPRNDAVNGADSQAVKRRSYRLSLVFIDMHFATSWFAGGGAKEALEARTAEEALDAASVPGPPPLPRPLPRSKQRRGALLRDRRDGAVEVGPRSDGQAHVPVLSGHRNFGPPSEKVPPGA